MTGFPTALPSPRVPDSRTAPALRWGVLGTGWIAERFVAALRSHTRQRVVAVGSRDAERAAGFAKRFGIPRSHGSYEDLAGAPDVDIVYVATPHNLHYPCARTVLDAGRHVLVEKPLALNASEATAIADLARRRDRFCMEAMWTFFLPRFDVVRQILDAGALGTIRTVLADNGEYFTGGHRILRPELAGGPLLDLGTYPVALATAVLGAPDEVVARGRPAPTGVNGQTAAILTHPGGSQSVIHTTLFSNTPRTATIAGTEATLVLAGPFYQPGPLTLAASDGRRTLTHDEPRIAHQALHHQAAAAADCIAAGRLQCAQRPLADSVATLEVLDEIRRQIGVRFAEEEA